MLYLVQPGGIIRWSDLPSFVLGVAQENRKDLSNIEWKPVQEIHDYELVVGVALRYGVACRIGIAVDGGEVVQATGPQRLARELATISETESRLESWNASQDALMEELSPGWTEHGEQLARRVKEGMKGTMARRVREADAVMAQPELPALKEHWAALGGALPSESS